MDNTKVTESESRVNTPDQCAFFTIRMFDTNNNKVKFLNIMCKISR